MRAKLTDTALLMLVTLISAPAVLIGLFLRFCADLWAIWRKA